MCWAGGVDRGGRVAGGDGRACERGAEGRRSGAGAVGTAGADGGVRGRAACPESSQRYVFLVVIGIPVEFFRQNITIQFCSERAGNPHPCESVSIRGQIACFLWRSVSFSKFGFGPRMDTDT